MSMNEEQYFSEVWEKVVKYLMDHGFIETEICRSFYLPSRIFSMQKSKIIIVAENQIAKSIIIDQTESIMYAFMDTLALDTKPTIEILQKSELSKLKTPVNPRIPDEWRPVRIQEDKKFDNFIVGDCNREAKAAALACSVKPGSYYNPLFIYGNSGLGKTHLMMAMCNYIKDRDPSKVIYYTESLHFVEMVVNAIRDNKIDEFKQTLYGIDVLLMDDIQFLAGKEKSHEIFFSIYNEMINTGRQVVLASDRRPGEIKGLEDRLKTRFSSGLTVGIDSPEFETSLAILRKKIESAGYHEEYVEEEGLSFIARNFSGNVRDLEGAWNRVLFYAIEFQKDGGAIRLETVMSALKGQAVVSEKSGLSPDIIIREVAEYYGLTKSQITSRTRTKAIANARHISIYLCRKLLDISYERIGEEFGGRDHSTVIAACTKVEDEIHKGSVFADAVSQIEKTLGRH
ncbi:MAG: chromosomal replication initiator protein DnaA [Solobacterium sp.]|nr:chromosomal replication initiator protein DnaA [Solobacterium sp.]